MKKTVLILIFIHFFYSAFSQKKSFQFYLRLPIQYDMQKAEIPLSFGTEIQNASNFNFGLDGLINYKIKKTSFYTGVGFFRNRFNIKRGYDHQALNSGRDSLPIGTETSNYTYYLFRLPMGFDFEFAKIRNINISIGAEYFLNFSFRRKYNGRLPFEGANTVYNGFTYFGNCFDLFINLSMSVNKNKIEIEPYVRVYNKYKKDRFLKENENETITRHMDAYGIGIRYCFTLSKNK